MGKSIKLMLLRSAGVQSLPQARLGRGQQLREHCRSQKTGKATTAPAVAGVRRNEPAAGLPRQALETLSSGCFTLHLVADACQASTGRALVSTVPLP